MLMEKITSLVALVIWQGIIYHPRQLIGTFLQFYILLKFTAGLS